MKVSWVTGMHVGLLASAQKEEGFHEQLYALHHVGAPRPSHML